jgi:hypothetical protein
LGSGTIAEIGNMPHNWDGYQAPPITQEVCAAAKGALEQLLQHVPLPEITPNSNATISFEWDAARGVAHLEIGRQDFSFFLKRNGSTPLYLQGPLGIMSADLLGRLILERLFSVKYDTLLVGDFRFAVDVQPQ